MTCDILILAGVEGTCSFCCSVFVQTQGMEFFFCFLPCEGVCGPWYNVPIPSKPLNQFHPKGSQKRLKLLSMT